MNGFFDWLRRSVIRRGPEGMVGGVCAGIARHFDWSPLYVRIGTLLAFLLPGIGVLTYVIVWILLPRYDGTIVLEGWLAPKSR
ncbi:PspC domain-containing protein [Mycetocola tolaasinivorans]|uniref:PspC domain-containing protein n=1 Tax=Mycetocola tolaasinivorans TaxID=76635 RepID=A0A3L7A478_9MICO|nr:PspC domain-containing protein [Mycetocola tolaasinivorans]RLP74758.1 PspC domain-containing protein [Mycetocola tolaasinivorans]